MILTWIRQHLWALSLGLLAVNLNWGWPFPELRSVAPFCCCGQPSFVEASCCPCPNATLPATITCTVSSACACLNGWTFTLTRSSGPTAQCSTWSTDGNAFTSSSQCTVIVPASCGVPATVGLWMQMFFGCGVPTRQINIQWAKAGSSCGANLTNSISITTCSPLVFGTSTAVLFPTASWSCLTTDYPCFSGTFNTTANLTFTG